MNRKKITDNMLSWIKGNIDLIGKDQTNIFSSFFFWNTFGKLCYIYENTKNDKLLNILKIIKKRINNKDINCDYFGVIITLAFYWNYLIQNIKIPVELSFIKNKISDLFNNINEQFETIDKLNCLFVSDVPEIYVNETINMALNELSNVRYIKYKIVKKPEYVRKIHNSFHYCSPYILLYLLSKLQCEKSFLSNESYTLLESVFIDGYNNIEELNLLDMALLLAASPSRYIFYVEKNIDILYNKFININDLNPYYYDNLIFGYKFVNSYLFMASIILECCFLAGKFNWKPFCEKQFINNESRVLYNKNSCTDINKNNKRFKMRNHCMAPVLDEGDEFDVSLKIDEIKLKDIIVFRHYSGKIMAHRVIDIIYKEETNVFITAADNGGLWGYPVFKRDLIGIVKNIYHCYPV